MKKIKKVKKRKIKNTIILAALLSAINIGFIGCKDVEAISNKVSTTEMFEDENSTELNLSNDNKIELNSTEDHESELQETTETEEATESQEDSLFVSYATVTANSDVNIRDNSENGNKIGVLPEGKSLKLLEKIDEDWYKVEYYDKIAYINAEYVYESEAVDINSTLKKVCYAVEEIKLYLPYYQDGETNYNEVTIPELECFEIYEEYDSYYLVKTNDYIGYIEKDKIAELTGNFVVVDISDQQLKLYSNNEVVLTTPVVTGKPKTSSDIGLFDVDGIDHNRFLRGPGYDSWVDIFMYYNGDEGLHDAEHHSCAAKNQHGWREPSEFGGETYLTDGSHGCINMLHDAVMEVSEYVEVGTKVLVKQ